MATNTGNADLFAYTVSDASFASASQRGGQADLYSLDVGVGRTSQLTNRTETDAQPAWLPDGRIVYTSWDSGQPRLRWLDPTQPDSVHDIDVGAGAEARTELEVDRSFPDLRRERGARLRRQVDLDVKRALGHTLPQVLVATEPDAPIAGGVQCGCDLPCVIGVAEDVDVSKVHRLVIIDRRERTLQGNRRRAEARGDVPDRPQRASGGKHALCFFERPVAKLHSRFRAEEAVGPTAYGPRERKGAAFRGQKRVPRPGRALGCWCRVGAQNPESPPSQPKGVGQI